MIVEIILFISKIINFKIPIIIIEITIYIYYKRSRFIQTSKSDRIHIIEFIFNYVI